MEICNDNNLEVKISKCESELKELNNETNKILLELEDQKKFLMKFSEEKKELESIAILNKEDILRYKDKIKELKKKKKMCNEKLLELKKEKKKRKIKK